MERARRKPAERERPSPTSSRAGRSDRAGPAHPVVRLQARAGNRAASTFLQARLLVGRPDDAYEREADRVAGEVMRMPEPAPPPPLQRLPAGRIQRMCPECEEEMLAQRAPRDTVRRLCPECEREERARREGKAAPAREDEAAPPAAGPPMTARRQPMPPRTPRQEEAPELESAAPALLQREHTRTDDARRPLVHHQEEDADRGPSPGPLLQLAGPAGSGSDPGGAPGPTVSPRLEAGIRSASGNGRPLPSASRGFFEPRFGADFSGVRVHTDGRAASAARQLRARAFTVGRDVFFGEGQYRPESAGGRRLMAHELTHVVQQGGGDAAEATPTRLRASPGTVVQRDEGSGTSEPGALAGGTAGTRPSGASAAPGGPQAATGRALEPGQETIEIPSFEIAGGDECFQIVPKEVCGEEAAGGDEAKSAPEGALSKLVDFALSGGVLGWATRKALSLAGGGARWTWRRIPLSVRAWAINKAIDLALAGTDFVPEFALKGSLMARWLRAGIRGYLKALRDADDAEKVHAFEKYLSIVLSRDLDFTLGYLKGLLCGFFVDGLVGIFQMIVDLVCLVRRIPDFVDALEKFFGVFPEEMSRAAKAMREFEAALAAAVSNGVAEMWGIITDPRRLAGLMETVAASGEATAKRMGGAVAEMLLAMAREPSRSLGFKIGKAAGMILFEIVLALVTAGGGLAATAVKTSTKVAVKLVATIGRHAWSVIRFLKPFFGMFRSFVSSSAKYLTRSFRFAARKLGDAIDAVRDFFAAILRRCRPGSLVCTVDRAKQVLGPRSRLITLANRRRIARILAHGSDIGLDAKTLRKIVSVTGAARKSKTRVLKHLDILAQRKIPGSAQVVGDLTVRGNKSQGARFVLRYIDDTGAWKNVKKFEVDAAPGGRRWDAVIRRTRYQMKDWGSFRKKTFAQQIVNDLKLTGLNRLRWVFSSRLGTKKEIIEMMEETLLDKKYGIPAAQARRIIAKLSRIVIVH